jgi:signal recognition particle subunit SRP72
MAPTNKTEDMGRELALVRKVRARRVPKGIVPGVTPPPDPERWLKKSERSTFQQARGKKKGSGGATQGVVESAGGSATGGHGRSGGHGRGKKRK